MNSTNFKVVKIPFATKKYYSNKVTKVSNKYEIWGYAYYIYDPSTGNIGKQFLQIKGADYRPTDKEMIKPTDHYRNLKDYSKKFRKDFLTPYNPNTVSNNEIETLDDLGIKSFNNLSFNHFNKVKSNFALLKGSNSAGSIGDNSKVEFKYYNFDIEKASDDEFNLHNFADFFNTRGDFKHNELGQTKFNDLEIINLKEYLDIFRDKQSSEKFNSARKVFKSFNYFVIDNEKESEEIVEVLNSILEKKDNKKTYEYIKKNLKDKKYIKKQIHETIKDYEEKLISVSTLKSKLRIRQKNLVNIEFCELKESNKIESNISSHLLKEYSGQDHSHIVSVEKCFSKKDYYSIADNDNCLLIPKSYHAMITNNQVTFNPEGNMIDKELKIIDNAKVSEVFLTEKRIRFLKENYDNWLKYKENM